jgi:secreted trypsin-like serine protease
LKRHRLISAVAAIGLLATAPVAAGSVGDGIVGGTQAAQGKYPAQAFLEIDGGAAFCGGTLIASSWVLTAAHCATDLDGTVLTVGRLRIGLGQIARNQITDIYGVAAVDIHAGYNPFTLQNDLALVRLDRPAPYAPLRVIRTDESAKWTPPATATITGWGVTESGEPSNELREATARIVANSTCVSAYGAAFDPNTMVCAGTGATDTCQGDSGGPLMVPDGPNAFVLAGVTSWGGLECADPAFPGVYVRLGAAPLNSWVVGARPTASFTAAGQNLGPTVTLTSTSANTEGGTFDSLLWDLDADGQYDDASGAIVSHTFPTSGTAQVGLLASKTLGDWASTRQTIRINRPPSASAAQSVYSVPEGRSVALAATATDLDGDALDYRWDLNGDKTFESTGQTTTFTALGLDGPVTRVATLRVCDFFGACVEATATVRVTNAPPRANAGRDLRAKPRQRLLFRMRATDPGRDRLRVLWRFGDGRRASGARVTHRYRRPGRYTVTATVIDDNGARATDRVRVRVTRR